MKKLSLVLFSLVLLTACQEKKSQSTEKKEAQEAEPQGAEALTGSTWALKELNGEKYSSPSEAEGVHVMLTDDGSKVSGYAGCNQLMGSFKLSADNGLDFGDVATTRRSCPDQNQNEQHFLKALKSTESYRISDQGLKLFDADNNAVAVFAKQEPKALAIESGKWQLKSLKGEPVNFDPKEGENLFFELEADARVIGFSGCNTFSGTYSLSEEKNIEFSGMLSTLKSCPDVDFKEARFLKVFEYTTTYSFEKEELKLYNSDQETLARFTSL
ncbi:MAG: META domain-containing protein [Psychroflexus sp.]|nr:META domain-containing protein [Psychroflexus sp.]MDN6309989.1 META domain-containing protein [Psychroflexus sp.]